jgi:hypothetical protein
MDRTFTDIQRNDENAAQSAPHLVEISIVPPERTATDEPMPPQSPPRATEPGAEKKTASDPALEVGLLSRQTTAAVDSAFNALEHAVRKQIADTGRIGPRNNPTPAEVVAGRQSSRVGRANGASGNWARFARALTTIPAWPRGLYFSCSRLLVR